MAKRMNAYEPPVKKNITRRTMDLAINQHVQEDSFSIALDDKHSIEFKKFVNPVLLQVFVNNGMSLAIKSDTESGMFYLDDLGVALTAHMFIIDMQSTIDLPYQKGEDGEETTDAEALAVMGEFFMSVSEDYGDLYDDVAYIVERRARDVISARNSLIQKMASKFDLNKLLESVITANAVQADLEELKEEKIKGSERATEGSERETGKNEGEAASGDA